MKTNAKILVAVLVAVSSTFASCSYHRTPPGTAETSTRYDSASKELTVECISTSSGTCHFIVASSGKQQALAVGLGTTSMIFDVDPAAHVCAAAWAISLRSCAWVPVHQVA